MLPSKIYNLSLLVGETESILVQGNYFKILSATGPVDVQSDFGKLEGLIFGQGLEKTPFSKLTFKNVFGASNDLKVFIGDENFVDGTTGNFAVISNKVAQSASFSNTQAVVTNASAQLLPANGNRQYLFVQNNDLTGSIFVSFGVAATLLNGIKIAPGAAYETANICSTQQIFAIGDVASNTAVVTVQG